MTGAVVFQLVGIFGPGIVVRRDDKVLGTVFIAAKPFLHTSGIVNDGQLIVVHQLGSQDRIPVGRTQTILTKMVCAAFKINGKLIKGKKITFKFKGKTYKVKTNKKGIAQKTLKKNIIKKLKKGKKYTVKVTYLKDTIKTTVKVK